MIESTAKSVRRKIHRSSWARRRAGVSDGVRFQKADDAKKVYSKCSLEKRNGGGGGGEGCGRGYTSAGRYYREAGSVARRRRARITDEVAKNK